MMNLLPSFRSHDYSLESVLFAGALLLIASVLSSRISSKFGVPSLLLFLAIGMLAGSEGPGGIDFDNYPLSFAVGTVCLAAILFDGGLGTPWKKVRPVLGLGVSLSLVGTIVTAAATAAFTHFFFNHSWPESFLLGAIVSSTDAAAVFSILRAKSLSVKGNLKETLEFEAGSNDPIAVFLTVGVLSYITHDGGGFHDFILLFFRQGGIGLALGWFGGRLIRLIINHIGIEYEGLYSVLLLGLIILLFSGTALLGGSGFLAVYVAGIVLGNSDLLHKASIVKFQDGIAWIAQITVFLTLGLLVYPTHLMAVWKEGIILALFMMFVARPASVLVAAPGSTLQPRERIFVSWVGLRGVAPIILATLPWSVGFAQAEHFFNLVFFVVLISVIAQGATIPWIANKLEITAPMEEAPPIEDAPGVLPAGFVSIEITVKPESLADNKRIVELGLPAGVLLTSLERENRYIIPRGDTVLNVGDRIWGLARPSNMEALKNLFGEIKSITRG